jgi:hypothetical protein
LFVGNQDSLVGIVTGYRLDVLSSIPSSARFFSSPQHPDQMWAHSASYPVGVRGSFHVGKAAWAHLYLVLKSRKVEPYFHSPICLLGIMCNEISRCTTLPFFSALFILS